MKYETEASVMAIVIETHYSQPFKLINGASERKIGMCARIIRHRYMYAL